MELINLKRVAQESLESVEEYTLSEYEKELRQIIRDLLLYLSAKEKAGSLRPNVMLITDHNGPDNTADYGVSFGGCNPKLEDYVRCATEEDALRLIKILGRLYSPPVSG